MLKPKTSNCCCAILAVSEQPSRVKTGFLLDARAIVPRPKEVPISKVFFGCNFVTKLKRILALFLEMPATWAILDIFHKFQSSFMAFCIFFMKYVFLFY